MNHAQLKSISIRVPTALLEQMTEHREREGPSVTWQFLKGAELYFQALKKS